MNAALTEQAREGEEKGRATAGVETSQSLPQGAPSVNPACVGCGGPHPFDTTVPSPLWNRVVRAGDHPDYLCATCVLGVFALAGESFTAELWGAGFNGVPIEVRVASADARAAADLGSENTRLRAALTEHVQEIEQLHAELTDIVRTHAFAVVQEGYDAMTRQEREAMSG